MELNRQNAELYLSALQEEGESDDRLQRARSRVTGFISFCKSKGIVSPTDSDIYAFIQSLTEAALHSGKKPLGDKTSRDYKGQIKKCLNWLKNYDINKTGGDNTMETQDNYVVVGEAAVTAQEERREAVKQAEPEGKKKAVRPKRTDGENKTHKFSIYFPQSTYTDLNELCHFYGRSISEQMLKLAEAFIGDNQNKLEIFREARNKAFNQ